MSFREDVTTRMMSGTGSFLTREGSDWTYSRGTSSATIRFFLSDEPMVSVDNGSGMLMEATQASFRGLYSDMGSFGDPQRYDRLTDGATVYEVSSNGSRCFDVTGTMIHIHAKQVHA